MEKDPLFPCGHVMANNDQINFCSNCGIKKIDPKLSPQIPATTNPNLMPRKKPWIGDLVFPKTNNISNDMKTLKVNDLLVWKGIPLSNKYLRTINEDERDEIAKDVFNYLLEYDFNHLTFKDQQIKQAWTAIKAYTMHFEEKDDVRYVTNSGTSGGQIYRQYFPNIIKISNVNRKSIYDILKDKDTLWATIRNRMGNTLLYNDDRDGPALQYPMNISLSQITIGAKNSGLASMGSIFKPTVAKAVYSSWVKDNYNVLDYSCGFGTRLLGLMACQFKDVKYFGYEPNTETFDGLQKLIKDFSFNAEIKKCGSETECFAEKMDFAFSSPPYFDFEKYSDESSQCYNAYPEYSVWLEKYWRKTVTNIKSMLKSDGIFGINIGGQANELMQKLEKDLNRVIIEEGFELKKTWYMKTSKSHLSSKKGGDKIKLEGIFFYGLK